MKVRIAETEKREKEMQDRARAVLSVGKKKEENADKKLAKELLRNNFAFCAEWSFSYKAEEGVVAGYGD